jgi:glucokinase
VLNGNIWRGMTGMAGEFGHIVVEPDGVPCTCGSRGCLEQYASATGIMRMAREAIGSGIAPGMEKAANSAEFTPRSVYALASQGDRPARKIFETVGRTLGIAVSDMVNILNLPMYVIGGGVASSWDAFAPALLEEVRYRSIVLTATALHSDSPEAHVKALDEGKTVIARAALGSDSGLYGAARLPMIAA